MNYGYSYAIKHCHVWKVDGTIIWLIQHTRKFQCKLSIFRIELWDSLIWPMHIDLKGTGRNWTVEYFDFPWSIQWMQIRVIQIEILRGRRRGKFCRPFLTHYYFFSPTPPHIFSGTPLLTYFIFLADPSPHIFIFGFPSAPPSGFQME